MFSIYSICRFEEAPGISYILGKLSVSGSSNRFRYLTPISVDLLPSSGAARDRELGYMKDELIFLKSSSNSALYLEWPDFLNYDIFLVLFLEFSGLFWNAVMAGFRIEKLSDCELDISPS